MDCQMSDLVISYPIHTVFHLRYLTCQADNLISIEEVIEHLRPLYVDKKPGMSW